MRTLTGSSVTRQVVAAALIEMQQAQESVDGIAKIANYYRAIHSDLKPRMYNKDDIKWIEKLVNNRCKTHPWKFDANIHTLIPAINVLAKDHNGKEVRVYRGDAIHTFLRPNMNNVRSCHIVTPGYNVGQASNLAYLADPAFGTVFVATNTEVTRYNELGMQPPKKPYYNPVAAANVAFGTVDGVLCLGISRIYGSPVAFYQALRFWVHELGPIPICCVYQNPASIAAKYKKVPGNMRADTEFITIPTDAQIYVNKNRRIYIPSRYPDIDNSRGGVTVKSVATKLPVRTFITPDYYLPGAHLETGIWQYLVGFMDGLPNINPNQIPPARADTAKAKRVALSTYKSTRGLWRD